MQELLSKNEKRKQYAPIVSADLQHQKGVGNLLQVKSKQRINDFGEVFTNPREVNAMCDLIPKDVWSDIGSTFLEPCCGEGVFILEILRRKFANCKKRKDYTAALRSVYGMELQADNVEITIQNIIKLCEEYFKITKAEKEIINDHIIQADSLKIMKMMSDKNLKG